jgi:hypothetical protein
MSAFVIGAYMRGVPMIYGGQEVNTPNSVKFYFENVDPIDWSGTNGAIHHEYKDILLLRKESAAIKYGTLNDFTNDDICGFTKELNGEEVMVLANLRDGSRSITIPASAQGAWKEAFTNAPLTVGGSVSMDAYSYTVYRRGYTVTGNRSKADTKAVSVYPNPVSDRMSILGLENGTRIEIYDVSGQVVFTKTIQSGSIDISSLPPGAYVLKAEGNVQSFVKQ